MLDGIKRLIKATKEVNAQWKQSHLLAHIVLRLIQRLTQDMQREDLAGIALDNYEHLLAESDANDFRTSHYFDLVTSTNPDSLTFQNTIATLEKKMYPGDLEEQSKKLNFVKIDVDGVLTSFLKFWKAYFERTPKQRNIWYARVNNLIAVLICRERSIDNSQLTAYFSKPVEDFVEREMKFCNFEERHWCILKTLECIYSEPVF